MVNYGTHILPVSLINVFHRESYFDFAGIIFVNAHHLDLKHYRLNSLFQSSTIFFGIAYLPTLDHPLAPHQL
jgi:hypothetical protein